MDNNREPQEKESVNGKLNNILTDLIKNTKKSEREHFVESLDSPLKEIKESMDAREKRNAELKISNLKNKVTLITFNGALITLMVASAEKIHYGIAPFLVLFFSFSVGVLELVIFYLMNETDFVKEKILSDKCAAVFGFCKTHREDQSAFIDTMSFIHHEACRDKKEYDDIPRLLADFEKTHNATKIFIKTMFFEMLFYLPLVIGFGQVIYKVFKFLPK